MSRIPRHPGGRKQNFDRPDVASATKATNREIGSFLREEPKFAHPKRYRCGKTEDSAASPSAIEPRSLNLCCPRRFDLLPSAILVGSTRRGNAAGDLRPAVMRLGQCRGEGNAGAGNLCTHRVRIRERRGDGD